MSRCHAIGLLLATLLGVQTAAAQQYPGYVAPPVSPYQRPTLSPYLNLLRGGNIAANYYLGVVPDVQQRSINAQFGSAILGLEQRTAEPAPSTSEELFPSLPSTGHPAYFMNYGSYFNQYPSRVGPPTTGRPAVPSRR